MCNWMIIQVMKSTAFDKLIFSSFDLAMQSMVNSYESERLSLNIRSFRLKYCMPSAHIQDIL